MRVLLSQIKFSCLEPDNVNVHRAAAKDMQAEKAARPAAPCATYCYPTVLGRQLILPHKLRFK